MHKVNVSVPAVSTNIGPGLDVLGLALNLRNVVEMSLTYDDRLRVEVRGEGTGILPENVHNPVMAAAIRLFQALEQAPPGLNVVCANAIPLDAGLGARTALIVGGLVGANNLLGGPFQREVLHPVGFAEVEGTDHVGMDDARAEFGLAQETLDRHRVGGKSGTQQLQRDGPPLGVFGEVDFCGPALTDGLLQRVAGDRAPDKRILCHGMP